MAMMRENWRVTLSVGVVNCESLGPKVTVDDILKEADRLMYDVKASGKGRARFAAYSH